MAETQTPTDPVLPPAAMNLVKPTAPVTARIAESRLCLKGKSASFVRHVAIDVSGTPLEGSFRAGQSFGIVPPGTDERGRPNKVRLYSLASPSWGEDGDGKVIATTPKRVIDERRPQRDGDDPSDHSLFVGLCSNYLCDLKEGDEIQVSGPNGKSFLLPADPSAHDYLFIATGTGIAPFRGMAMELLDGPGGPCPSQVHVVMGAPYTTDLLYDDQMRAWADQHDTFHYHTAISRESSDGSDRGLYVDGYVDRHLDEVFGPLLRSPRTLIYVCGLAGVQVGLLRMLAARGVGEGFLEVRDEAVAATDPRDWTGEQIRRHVRATKRMMVEVY